MVTPRGPSGRELITMVWPAIPLLLGSPGGQQYLLSAAMVYGRPAPLDFSPHISYGLGNGAFSGPFCRAGLRSLFSTLYTMSSLLAHLPFCVLSPFLQGLVGDISGLSTTIGSTFFQAALLGVGEHCGILGNCRVLNPVSQESAHK